MHGSFWPATSLKEFQIIRRSSVKLTDLLDVCRNRPIPYQITLKITNKPTLLHTKCIESDFHPMLDGNTKIKNILNRYKSFAINTKVCKRWLIVCLNTSVAHKYNTFNQDHILFTVARCVEQKQIGIKFNRKGYWTQTDLYLK